MTELIEKKPKNSNQLTITVYTPDFPNFVKSKTIPTLKYNAALGLLVKILKHHGYNSIDDVMSVLTTEQK